jgi:photosystem II stability/assembly factor-like uncharacterized protein
MMKKTILLLILALMVTQTSLSCTALAAPEKNFLAMSNPATENLNAVWGTAANSVYAVGNKGTILHYNGTSWSSMASGTTTNLERPYPAL